MDKTSTLLALLAQMDQRLMQWRHAIIHHACWQRLEASWRGLMIVVQTAARHGQVQVRVLTVSQLELSRDLLSVLDVEHSQLFAKVYQAEFDQAGGQPYGLLIGDYYFSHVQSSTAVDQVGLLAAIAQVAAHAFAPFISGVAPSLLSVDRFSRLQSLVKIGNIFNQSEYQRWQRLQKTPAFNFLGLAMPRVLLRVPWEDEYIDKHEDYLWGNAAYAYACMAINAFASSGWFTQMSDGMLYWGIRDHYAVDNQHLLPKFNTEIDFTDQQQRELALMGLLVLRDNPWAAQGFFNVNLPSCLHHILCAARFAHYIKVIVRDKIGSFINAKACEQFLQRWLLQYCMAGQDSAASVKARYPLNQADVLIRECPGMPGQYYCLLKLKPHYPLARQQTQFQFMTAVHL